LIILRTELVVLLLFLVRVLFLPFSLPSLATDNTTPLITVLPISRRREVSESYQKPEGGEQFGGIAPGSYPAAE
jgi:hypothetical protein